MNIETVSVIIPTLNEERHLPLLLDSLLKNDFPLEIIVVDGKSEDKTRAIANSYVLARSTHWSVRVINSEKRHIAYQRNLGAGFASSDVLLFLDADVILPHSDTIGRLVSEFKEKRLSAANPKFVAHPHEKTFFIRAVFFTVRIFHRCAAFFKRPYFGGACIITRKDIFQSLNGFDERLMLSEDTDYGLRARAFGPSGLVAVEVSTSARRLEKVGTRELWETLKIIPEYLRTGKVPETYAKHYVFGDYQRVRQPLD